ncbi:MAG: NEW3 domain-containing protein, partial [Thermoplasmatota archaeon]
PDAVRQLAFTPDGTFLAIRSATQVSLALNGGNLTEMWRDTPAAPPVGLGVSSAGDFVATGVGSGVMVYTVAHGIRADPLAETMPPGGARTVSVVYHNDGNRPEKTSLETWFPGGWYVSATPSNFTVPADGTATVSVRIVLPSQEPPGKRSVLLNHTLESGGHGTSRIDVTVTSRELLVLSPAGPTSLAIRGGQTVQFSAAVENRGNEQGVAHLSIATEPAGWRATLSASSLTLLPGRAVNVTVSLTAPDRVVEGDAGHVRLTLAERPQEPIDLYGTVGARFKVGLTVPPTLVVPVGNASAASVIVQNLGNVLDSIDLSVGDLPEGWQAVFPPGNGTVRDLAAGASGSARLLVRAPADAEPGVKVRLTVHATSEGNPDSETDRPIILQAAGAGGEVPPDEETAGSTNWLVVGGIGLAVLAVAGFVAGAALLRKK